MSVLVNVSFFPYSLMSALLTQGASFKVHVYSLALLNFHACPFKLAADCLVRDLLNFMLMSQELLLDDIAARAGQHVGNNNHLEYDHVGTNSDMTGISFPLLHDEW